MDVRLTQLMLAIFWSQGIRNRTFFSQRAKKHLLEDSRLRNPGTLYLGVPGERRHTNCCAYAAASVSSRFLHDRTFGFQRSAFKVAFQVHYGEAQLCG
jgi:hypothetical protein